MAMMIIMDFLPRSIRDKRELCREIAQDYRDASSRAESAGKHYPFHAIGLGYTIKQMEYGDMAKIHEVLANIPPLLIFVGRSNLEKRRSNASREKTASLAYA